VTATQAARHAIWPKDRRTVTSDGTTIAYTVVGDGPGTPVVFMNGWTCPDTYWRRVAPAVIDHGHPAVFFDTRGHAQSGLPRPAGLCARNLRDEDISVNRVARDIIEVLDAAGIDRAVLVGHSMGVQGIFEAYRVGPDRLAGIVPVAGTYENPVPTFMEKDVLDRLFPIGDALLSRVPFGLLRPVMGQAYRMPEAIGMRIIRAILRPAPSVTYDDVVSHIRQIGEVDFSVMWRMMSQMRSHSAADVLPTIEVPVLILGGAKDHFTPPSVQHRMAALIPDSELVLFPEGGHLLPVEEADGIAAALADWLDRRVR
jgi:pimeloyl-ACP methyl ester carboxylesterase